MVDEIRHVRFSTVFPSLNHEESSSVDETLADQHRVIDLITSDSTFKYPSQANPFVLSFSNLSYSVKTRKTKPACHEQSEVESNKTKLLLNNISGEAREGEITAILGASGSGKTTLIDALADRIERKSLKGTLTLNGEVAERQLLKVISAYVRQDDLLFPMLTVEETLMFSAEFRLPRSVSKKKKKERVQTLIDQLGLGDAAKTVIGDEGHRGVSGGERRRVSIGVDIIHDPILLFLDEPTSGLDSSSAFTVVKVLQTIARTGSIVIMSIHQPSYRVESLLDKTIFLSRGQVVYNDKPSSLLPFFTEFGYSMPNNENPSEFTLDLINELEQTPGGITNLVEFNNSWQKNKKETDLEIQKIPLIEAVKLRDQITQYRSNQTFANPFWIETMVIAKRLITNARRMPEHFLCRYFTVMITAIMMASLYWHLSDSPKGTKQRMAFIAYTVTTLLFIDTSEITQLFQERFIFIRETAYNAYRHSSYVLAHSLVSVPAMILFSVTYSVITFWAVGLHGGLSGFLFYVLVNFATFWASTSYIAFVTGLISDNILAFTIVVSTFGYFSLFSGFYITREEIPLHWLWLHYISLVKYSYQAILQNEFSDPRNCFVRGVQVWDHTPFVNVPEMTKVNMLECVNGATGANITSSSCVIDGMTLMGFEGVTDISKWICFSIVVASGFLFRFLFYLTLLFGGKNKRR